MSRTYRKRSKKHEYEFDITDLWTINWLENISKKYSCTIEQFKTREIRKYYSHTEKYYEFTLPKVYRNSINRQRRRKDKQALHNEVYEKRFPDYASWNCKDSESWGYW